MNADRLPPPDTQAAALSDRLTRRIRAEIDAHGGWLRFDRYMELALYEPGLGYYSAGSVKLGPEGDFVTAPELSELFGRCLARWLGDVLGGLERPVVLEAGAGSGRLARTLLDSFDADGVGVDAYRILELSADLKARQRRCLARHASRVRWLETPPAAGFDGVVLANEVADALPVAVFVKRGGRALPLGVVWRAGRLAWAEGPPDAELDGAVAAIEDALGAQLPEGYRSEIRPSLPAWIGRLAASLTRGLVLLIDYGCARHEYYHPERARGTLVCHYRHRAHDDPFVYPGLQDLSAWVDFSACAEAGRAAGLAVAGYTTQAQFLLHGGAAQLLERLSGAERLRESGALKTLMLPGEMGERFKLLALTRGVTGELPGRDFRDRL